MISRILVPTDGSKVAQKAAQYAIALARKTGAAILLLSVIDKRFLVVRSIPSTASPTHLIEPIEEYLRQAAEIYLKEIEELCKKNKVRSKTSIRTGHPIEEILKEVKKSKIDLIVMGSHGRNALKAAVIGSVAFGVIHKETKAPVLIVKK